MSHLYVDLYDQIGDDFPCGTVEDHDVRNRRYFHDLHWLGVADRVARVVVRPGEEYHRGDHIRLLGEARLNFTDTVAIDPLIAADVNLNEVMFDERSFTERAEAVLIVTNPNPDSSFRLRVNLYDQTGQKLPSLIFYDWEYQQELGPINLAQFHFNHKAAVIRLETGPDYRQGDNVTLWATLEPGAQTTYTLEPGDYDLTRFPIPTSESVVRPQTSWAKALSAIEFKLQPRLVRH
jgi:hypothetical protein